VLCGLPVELDERAEVVNNVTDRTPRRDTTDIEAVTGAGAGMHGFWLGRTRIIRIPRLLFHVNLLYAISPGYRVRGLAGLLYLTRDGTATRPG
jgi:hypothetical protein